MDGLARVDAAPRLRTLVAARIREAIATGALPPGSRLIERSLCESLGVSRTSVREALRELESEGLISAEGGRPSVTKLSPEETRDLYQVRVVLEGFAARLFAERATAAQMQTLEAAWRELEAIYRDYAPGPFLMAKARFYEILFEGAGNATAAAMLRVIHTKVSQLRALSLSDGKRSRQSIREIGALVKALKARDADLAARLAVEHIENAARAACAAQARALDAPQAVPPAKVGDRAKGKTS